MDAQDPGPLRWLEDGSLLLTAEKFRPLWETLTQEKVRVRAVVGFVPGSGTERVESISPEALIFQKLMDRLHPKHSELATFEYFAGCLSSTRGTACIEAAVRRCREAVDGMRTEPWFAITGGIPSIREVVKAAAELHFGTGRSFLCNEDGHGTVLSNSPQESLIARRHALAFLRQGALVEAAAMAQPYLDDPQEVLWAGPLWLAARFLDDNPVVAYAAGKPPRSAFGRPRINLRPPAYLCDLATEIFPGKGKPQRRCLLVGLRTEAALRSGKWIEAINGSLTFHDVAFRDMLERKLGPFLNDRILRLDNPLSEADRQAICGTGRGPESRPCLAQIGRSQRFSLWGGREHDEILMGFLGGAMEDMFEALKPLRRFRNRNTHDILGHHEVAECRRQFLKSGLWNKGKGQRNLSLLDADLPNALLHELGYGAGNVLDRLLAELEGTVLCPSREGGDGGDGIRTGCKSPTADAAP